MSKEIEAFTSETQQPISQISSFYGFLRIIVKHRQTNHIAQTNKGFYTEKPYMSHPEFSDLVNEWLSDYVKICFPSVETQ